MKGATSRERRWCSSHVNKGQAWVSGNEELSETNHSPNSPLHYSGVSFIEQKQAE